MQQDPLLNTKLHIPHIRPELVSRPRLLERLNSGLDRKLTLVSAPAGFGKTTLICDWVGRLRQDSAEDGRPASGIAWLSLDEGDSDPARFLAYIVSALRTTGAHQDPGDKIGRGVLSALLSPQPPPTQSVLISLINDMAAVPDRTVLVLDDYHLIATQAIHETLTFLLEHLPPRMHLVIATREDPDLPLARLRARGQLTELRATELRFSTSEAAEFLNQLMRLDLSAEDVAALEARTEGWIAGLQLAALALQGVALQGTFSAQGGQDAHGFVESFIGSHRYVLDYLIEEVLEQQPESVQTFLLQTAVLDRLSGPLCDALTGQDDGQATLEKLERANLFLVPLDEERRWYRYHHLFSSLLQRWLNESQPERVPTLRLRASQWYEQNGFAHEAIEHALRAQDFARAADLIDEHSEAAWRHGGRATLRRWLGALPVDVIRSKAHLSLFHAWYLFTGGQQVEAEQCLKAVEQALESGTDLAPDRRDRISDPDRQKLRGRAAVIRAFMASFLGDVPAIIQYAGQALEALPEQDLIWRSNAALALGDAQGFRGDMPAAYEARLEAAEASSAAGNTVFAILAYIKVAITLREQGRLGRAIEVCLQQLRFADSNGLSRASVAGGLLAIWGEALAELGDLEGALDLTKRGVELAECAGEAAMRGWSYQCLTRALFSAGELPGAEAIIQKAEDETRESSVPPWNTRQMEAWRTRLWLAQGKLEAASQWARERGLVVAPEAHPLLGLGYYSLNDQVMLARILIAEARLDEASGLLPRLLEAAEAGGRTSSAIEILVLQALALQAGGETEGALSALERALTLAEPKGFVRTFVDEGQPMANLLRRLAARGTMPDYSAKLLAAFDMRGDAEAGIQSQPALRPPSVLFEPLSKRELEVLQLLAGGLTNREIATRLFLSLNTVKAHTRNIYGKLDVHSRTRAVARATELGLL